MSRSNPLTVDLSLVNLGTHLVFPQPRKVGLFFGGLQIFSILQTYDQIYATTYTFDPEVIPLPLTKVICVELKSNPKNGTEVRIANNNHSKVFLCFWQGKLVDGFCGSWNLTTPTLVEMIVKLNSGQLKEAKRFFEFLWIQCK